MGNNSPQSVPCSTNVSLGRAEVTWFKQLGATICIRVWRDSTNNADKLMTETKNENENKNCFADKNNIKKKHFIVALRRDKYDTSVRIEHLERIKPAEISSQTIDKMLLKSENKDGA